MTTAGPAHPRAVPAAGVRHPAAHGTAVVHAVPVVPALEPR
ncbi:hypothetical protein [Streptomyces sp. t39]|nr:hypothetical protein [Streptomyces sp. t39]